MRCLRNSTAQREIGQLLVYNVHAATRSTVHTILTGISWLLHVYQLTENIVITDYTDTIPTGVKLAVA